MDCLDANAWVYYLDAELLDAELFEYAEVHCPVRTLLSERPLFTTAVIQMEAIHYLHNQLAESQATIDRFLYLGDVTVAELMMEDVTERRIFSPRIHTRASVATTRQSSPRWNAMTPPNCGPTMVE